MATLETTEHALRSNRRKAFRGWQVWHRFAKHFGLKKTTVVIMPSDDSETNYFSLLYLDRFTKAHKNTRSIILTSDESIATIAPLLSKTIHTVVIMDPSVIGEMMCLWNLFAFSSRTVVASLDQPEGRKADKLVGLNDTTVEELVVYGVYSLKPPQRLSHRPRFKSEDFLYRDYVQKYTLFDGHGFSSPDDSLPIDHEAIKTFLRGKNYPRSSTANLSYFD